MSAIKSFLSFIGLSNKSDNDLYLPVYSAIMAQARKPFLYGKKAAPDTFDGRFDVLVIHIYLVLRRLRQDGLARHGAGQIIFDLFFRDMDQAMREMGVGDLSVGKKVKKMAEAFYGRVNAYDAEIEQNPKAQNASLKNDDALADAVARNLYPEEVSDIGPAFAAYMRDMRAYLNNQATEKVLSRDIFDSFEGHL